MIWGLLHILNCPVLTFVIRWSWTIEASMVAWVLLSPPALTHAYHNCVPIDLLYNEELAYPIPVGRSLEISRPYWTHITPRFIHATMKSQWNMTMSGSCWYLTSLVTRTPWADLVTWLVVGFHSVVNWFILSLLLDMTLHLWCIWILITGLSNPILHLDGTQIQSC